MILSGLMIKIIEMTKSSWMAEQFHIIPERNKKKNLNHQNFQIIKQSERLENTHD